MSRSVLSRRAFLTAATASIAVLPGSAEAGTLVVPPLVIASEDYPPYAFNFRGHRKGYDVDKVTMVLDELRLRPVHRSMTRTGIFGGLDEATVDLGFPFTQTPLRTQKYLLVGPLHTNRFVLAMRSADAKGPLTYASLAGLRVGVTDRHRYPPEFDALENITRISSTSLTSALRRLGYGRVDAVIGDRSAMEAIVQAEGLEHQLTVSTSVLAAGPAFVLFPKSRAALAQAFGDALHRLDAASRFKEIDARYPMVEPPK